MRTVLASLIVVVVAGGCGGDNTPTATSACADRASASCQLRNVCSNGTGVGARYGTLSVCLSRETQSCTTNLAAPGTAATPPGVEACAAALPAEGCPDFNNNNSVAACLPPSGTRANGQPCGASGQCQSTFCAIPTGTLCGTCAALPVAYAPCVDTGETVRGFRCVPATHLWQLLGVQSSTCNADLPCGAGLACVGAGGAGTCQIQATGVGDACDVQRVDAPDCDRSRGLYCTAHKNGKCASLLYVATGSCGRVPEAIDGGSAPDAGVTLEGVACLGGAMCVIPAASVTGTCVAPATEGAACDTTGGPPCLAPARCVGGGVSDGGTAGTCQLIDPASCG